MTAPEDTSSRPAATHLIGILSEGQSGYIEGMEAAGQRQLVTSAVLPTEGLDTVADLLAEVGDPLPDDPMFTPVVLPDGWTHQGTEHPLWSEVIDDTGRVRINAFYKAAFYDRRAFCQASRG